MDLTVKEIIREFEEEHFNLVATSVIIFYDSQDYIFLFMIASDNVGLYEAWMKAPYDEEEEVGTWERIGKPKELIWDCLNDIKRQWKKIAGEY
jgi:hypothetical protein